ncbi:hypothetical protein V6U90_27550, partial [Micromonospora sp. CPCC 206060]|uniref:hypothetical protein n=1 Tax=Micromonospora sp. CPCC 206060 TaxID=3122406 RepID=UPI002FF32618
AVRPRGELKAIGQDFVLTLDSPDLRHAEGGQPIPQAAEPSTSVAGSSAVEEGSEPLSGDISID